MKTIFILSMLLAGVANAYDSKICIKILTADMGADMICSRQWDNRKEATKAAMANPNDPALRAAVSEAMDEYQQCREQFVKTCESL